MAPSIQLLKGAARLAYSKYSWSMVSSSFSVRCECQMVWDGKVLRKVMSRITNPQPNPADFKILLTSPESFRSGRSRLTQNRFSRVLVLNMGVYGPPHTGVTRLAPRESGLENRKVLKQLGLGPSTLNQEEEKYDQGISIRAKVKSGANVSLPWSDQAWGRSEEPSGAS